MSTVPNVLHLLRDASSSQCKTSSSSSYSEAEQALSCPMSGDELCRKLTICTAIQITDTESILCSCCRVGHCSASDERCMQSHEACAPQWTPQKAKSR